MFKGSGIYIEAGENIVDTILVDEAHRLNEKSGMFQNMGENQIKEIIHAGLCSVFFIDESQRVTLSDIGRVSEIEDWAKIEGAEVIRMKLVSQFRCNGSDGYLSWLDNTLDIRETANCDMEEVDYDIRVMDSPHDMRDLIIERNRTSNNKARILAGYCWNWIKEGVIIGEDLRYEDGKVVTDFTKRAKTDLSLKGIKKLYKADPDKAIKEADEIIKNTYRTLMTRGMKGCYVYCVDEKLADYFRDCIKK